MQCNLTFVAISPNLSLIVFCGDIFILLCLQRAAYHASSISLFHPYSFCLFLVLQGLNVPKASEAKVACNQKKFLIVVSSAQGLKI